MRVWVMFIIFSFNPDTAIWSDRFAHDPMLIQHQRCLFPTFGGLTLGVGSEVLGNFYATLLGQFLGGPGLVPFGILLPILNALLN